VGNAASAILKGWIDRVIRPDIGCRFVETDAGESIPFGLLAAKVVQVFNTSHTPPEREQKIFGDPLERIWKDCLVAFCGLPFFRRRMFGIVVTGTGEQCRVWLDPVREITRKRFPPSPSYLPRTFFIPSRVYSHEVSEWIFLHA
jgi:putative NADPH-quinone reductase